MCVPYARLKGSVIYAYIKGSKGGVVLSELLLSVKLLLGTPAEDSQYDNVLLLLLGKCELFVRAYCNIDDEELGDALLSVCVDLTAVKFNKLGSEGLKNETVGPLRMDYEDVPADIAAILKSFRRVRF